MSATKVNKAALFFASCLALTVTSLTFAIRASLENVFGTEFELSAEDIGWAFGPAFWGFTLSMLVGGQLVDSLGMKKIVYAAWACHLVGIVVTLFASSFVTLFIGTLFIGIANGFVEASLNPLVASLYPEQKTKMLNRFHVWFPGGIVIGSLLAYLLLQQMNLSWQLLVGLLLVPNVIYGLLFSRLAFPETERRKMGVSTAQMWSACISPLFLFIAFCMLLTASTELGTTQRIESLLADAAISPLLILALITGTMAVGRLFAGPIVKQLSPSGMLLFSAVFSFIGLFWLSQAEGGAVIAAALLFAVGVCFFWPTMLGFVAEYIPQSGALGLAIVGGLGMFSVSLVLPLLGSSLDSSSPQETLGVLALLPGVLILLFGGLFIYMRKRA
jgi:MFS family permease